MKKSKKFRLINCGEWFFKVRSYTPIPLFLFMLFCFYWEWEHDILVWSSGLFFLIAGESLRLWSLRYIGKASRTRKKKCRVLIKNGPYALVRNPLYCGNLFILIGVTILSELVWFIPIVVLLFFIQYYCIVLWEETVLLEYFSESAKCYFESVPRWLPKWKTITTSLQRSSAPLFPWQEIFYRERSTLVGLIIMCSFMMMKELYLD